MLKKISKALTVVCISGVLLTGVFASCSKQNNDQTTKATQTPPTATARFTDPDPYKMNLGEYYVDNMTQEVFCGACMDCFCHIGGGTAEDEFGMPDIVGLELTDANKVRVINHTTSVLTNITVSSTQPLPPAFASGAGYSAINIAVGSYPIVTNDPAYPHGYYELDVLLIP